MRTRHYVIAALTAGAMMYGGSAFAQGLDGSPHDLGGIAGDNGEICVYCHTPHGARTDIEAPLWNKPSGATTYQTYDSSTIDGQILTVGSVSVACLTCHDGTQARDAVINAPGSGAGQGFTNGTATTTIGTITNGIANLGADLRNDHPIGIQYGGFDAGSGKIDADIWGAGESLANVTDGLATNALTGSAARWWVDTATTDAVGVAGTRDKTDMILYTRDNGGTFQPFVECGSCHDPHVNDAGNDGLSFMRISNTNSNVCRACHNK